MTKIKQKKSTEEKAPRQKMSTKPGTLALPEKKSDRKSSKLLVENIVNMSSAHRNWGNLPHHVLGDFLTMLGRDSFKDLHKGRQVCQIWNLVISQMNKYDKDTIIRKAKSRAAQIRFKWTRLNKALRLPEITTAASLAYHGLLSKGNMNLHNVNLTSVPAEHLASLASSVKKRVVDISKCDLIPILLVKLKCELLIISKQSLSTEETRALVLAMESGVEEVWLGVEGEVSLDIMALTQYSGQGDCRKVLFCNTTADSYMEKLRSWQPKIKMTMENGFRSITIGRRLFCSAC